MYCSQVNLLVFPKLKLDTIIHTFTLLCSLCHYSTMKYQIKYLIFQDMAQIPFMATFLFFFYTQLSPSHPIKLTLTLPNILQLLSQSTYEILPGVSYFLCSLTRPWTPWDQYQIFIIMHFCVPNPELSTPCLRSTGYIFLNSCNSFDYMSNIKMLGVENKRLL